MDFLVGAKHDPERKENRLGGGVISMVKFVSEAPKRGLGAVQLFHNYQRWPSSDSTASTLGSPSGT